MEIFVAEHFIMVQRSLSLNVKFFKIFEHAYKEQPLRNRCLILAKKIESRITKNVQLRRDHIWENAKLWHKNKMLNLFRIHYLTSEMNKLIEQQTERYSELVVITSAKKGELGLIYDRLYTQLVEMKKVQSNEQVKQPKQDCSDR